MTGARGWSNTFYHGSSEMLMGADRMNTQVGPFGIEVLEDLKRLRVVLSP